MSVPGSTARSGTTYLVTSNISSVAPQNLCTAYIMKMGGGKAGLKLMLDTLNGPSESNAFMAEYLLKSPRKQA